MRSDRPSTLTSLPRDPNVVLLRSLASGAAQERLISLAYDAASVEFFEQLWSVKHRVFLWLQNSECRLIDVKSVAPKSGSQSKSVVYVERFVRRVPIDSLPVSVVGAFSSNSVVPPSELPQLLTALNLPERSPNHKLPRVEKEAVMPFVVPSRCSECGTSVTQTHPFDSDGPFCCCNCDFPLIAIPGLFVPRVMQAVAESVEQSGTTGAYIAELSKGVCANLKQHPDVVAYFNTLNDMLGSQPSTGLTIETVNEIVLMMYRCGMLQADVDLTHVITTDLKPTRKTQKARIKQYSLVRVFAPASFIKAPVVAMPAVPASSSSSGPPSVMCTAELRVSALMRDLITHHHRFLLTACPVSLLYVLIRARQHSDRLAVPRSGSCAPDFEVRPNPDLEIDLSAAPNAGAEGDDADEDESDDEADQHEDHASNVNISALFQRQQHLASRYHPIIAAALHLPVPGG